jgi:hypothetical protein
MMKQQEKLDQSLYMEAHGGLVDSYTIELV